MDPKTRRLFLVERGSGEAARDALAIISEAFRRPRRGHINERAVERRQKIERPWAKAQLEITLDYLDAQKEARRRANAGYEEVSADDVLRERFSATVNLDRPPDNLSDVEKAAEIASIVKQTVQIAKDTISALGKEKTPTKRELQNALGLTKRSAKRLHSGTTPRKRVIQIM